MTKIQSQPSKQQQKQRNKSHKTLRQKLRKRRLEQKAHIKQKKQKHRLFNAQQQKKQFFQKHFSSLTEQKQKQAKKEFKYKKINKYIEKFINLYQDDLEDFFNIFKEFDQGGYININGLENKKLQKVLKKLFKYLPLNIEIRKNEQNGNQEQEYKKKKGTMIGLENVIRNMVTQAIENYMENGTEDQKGNKNQQSSEEENDKQKGDAIKKGKVKKEVTVNVKNQQQQGIFTFPKNNYPIEASGPGFGPMISAQQRQKIAQLFEQQLKEMQEQKETIKKNEQDEFEKIFSMGTTANKLSDNRMKKPVKSTLEDIPEHLYAEGSAKLGQKVTVNDEDLQDYDKTHRPKKLIQQHRQILAINRGQPEGTSKTRKPFDRERDVVNSRNRMTVNNMKNGVFFDFKDRMSAPKKTNNFL